MKKKSLLVGAVMVMSAMMLNACGGPSKEDYKSDIKTLNEFTEEFTSLDDMDAYEDAASKLEMKTEEGKVLKEDMKKLGDYMGEMNDMMSDLENVDEDDATKLQEKVEKLEEETEKHVDDFEDAAKDAGVKDEDLEKLGL